MDLFIVFVKRGHGGQQCDDRGSDFSEDPSVTRTESCFALRSVFPPSHSLFLFGSDSAPLVDGLGRDTELTHA